MTPKQQFAPFVEARLTPLLAGVGFKKRGITYTKSVTEDVEYEVRVLVVRPIHDAC